MALSHLCQALLNGPIQRADLRAAEVHFTRALRNGKSSIPPERPTFGHVWRCDLLPGEGQQARVQWLRQVAPVFLLEPCWLARVALPATAHGQLEGLLLQLFMNLVGLKDPASAPGLRFRASLVTGSVHLPLLGSPHFFGANPFPASVLRFSALHLALMHRPRQFFPELLGYTVAHCHREYEEGWLASESWSKNLGIARRILEAATERWIEPKRILDGWTLYTTSAQAIRDELLGLSARATTSPETRLTDILQAKLPQALGYHGRIRLQGRCLDEWLSECRQDPQALLKALQQSGWIDTQRPHESRLMKAMQFGGPMFGVFDDVEQQTLVEWMERPPAMPTAPALATSPERSVPFGAMLATGPVADGGFVAGDGDDTCPGGSRPGHADQDLCKKISGVRDLYRALLGAESAADAPVEAGRFIRHRLRRTRWLDLAHPGSGCFAYTPDALRAFTETRHRRELDRYRPLSKVPDIDRDFCRWVILQLAPAILNDGAWLSDCPGPAEKLDAPRGLLLKIYLDELGEGITERNHSNVFRRLLRDEGLELPDFSTADFAGHPSFLDAAFEIPTYLLAMGLCSDRFGPERLGLNLAIELGGLGASYMTAIDLMRHHGMDSTIICLHLSIDNLASGHACWAREAIVAFLDEVRQRDGSVAMKAAWRRIWLGYRSFRTASLPLTLGILGRYAMHRLGWRVKPGMG